MNKMHFLLFAIIFTCSAPLCAQTLTVVTEEYPPYTFTENGTITGFLTEIVEEVLKRADIRYTLALHPWARVYNMALVQPNVLIYSIGRTDIREKLFKWVGVVYSISDIYLYKLKKRTDINIKNLDDAKKYKIGVVPNDIRSQYLKKNGFEKGKNLDFVTRDLQNIKKLLRERIDLSPFSRFALTHMMKHQGMEVEDLEQALYLKDLSEGLYIAFSLKTDDAFVEKCKAALAEIKKDGTFDAILKKYTP